MKKAKINEEKLDVTVVHPKTSKKSEIDVFENPSVTQTLSLIQSSSFKELRGLSFDDSFFVWDAGISAHAAMILGLAKLGIRTNMSNVGYFYLELNESKRIIFSDVGINANSLKNKRLLNFLKSPKVEIGQGLEPALFAMLSQMKSSSISSNITVV